MEHDTSRTVLTGRCGHCGGSLRPDAPWCTLCLTRTAPDPEPVAAPAAPTPGRALAPLVDLDPLTAPLELLVAAPADRAPAPGWPCASCEATNPLDATACRACGSGFLEQVRLSEPPLLVLPLVGDLSRLDKLQQLALALAAAVVVTLATLLVGLLLS